MAITALLPRAVGAAPAAQVAVVTRPGPVVSVPLQWVQNHRLVPLFASADGDRTMHRLEQWTYLRVTGKAQHGRWPVAVNGGAEHGWIDAAAIGPSGPPPAVAGPTESLATRAPAPVRPLPAATLPHSAPVRGGIAGPASEFWIAPHQPTPLWRLPRIEGFFTTVLPRFGPLRVTGPAQADFYPVEEPFSKSTGWVEASAIGRVGPPASLSPALWWGRIVVDEAFARAEPRRDAQIVGQMERGAVVGFSEWVEGEQVTWDDPAWGQIAPDVFMYGRLARPLDLPTPPTATIASVPSGRWIGINRTLQIVVAYEDERPLFWARTSTGRPGWETPLGTFSVRYRVAKETMDSRTLIGRDAERADYRIEDVKYTQYFTSDGNALHENWWKDPDTFGLPSSHGCAGLRPDDARAFWEFGATGMPVIVHR
jgi:hypothetical protein